MLERKISALLEQGHTPALATIIDKGGSAPRLPGSKMLVEANGATHGTIGGGRLELLVHEKAQAVAAGGVSLLEEFHLRGSGESEDREMVCGGRQLVLIERLLPGQASLFQRALHCLEAREPGLWLLDITDPGAPRRTFLEPGEIPPGLEEIDLRALLRQRRTRLLKTAGGATLVVEPLNKQGTLLLVGGGHVARETARLAAFVDFEVVVVDDRPDFCSPQRFPMARSTHLITDFTRVFDRIPVDEETYLLIMTHSHGHDQQVLARALRTPARYIGMIGSSRKRRVIFSHLKKQGVAQEELDRVCCPVGLDIGSETPAEIAVSIIAELIAVRAGLAGTASAP